jgi:hypothetical protein
MGKPLGIVPWHCSWKVTWPRRLWKRLSLMVRRRRRWLRIAPDVPLDAWRNVCEPIFPRLRRGGQTKSDIPGAAHSVDTAVGERSPRESAAVAAAVAPSKPLRRQRRVEASCVPVAQSTSSFRLRLPSEASCPKAGVERPCPKAEVERPCPKDEVERPVPPSAALCPKAGVEFPVGEGEGGCALPADLASACPAWPLRDSPPPG